MSNVPIWINQGATGMYIGDGATLHILSGATIWAATGAIMIGFSPTGATGARGHTGPTGPRGHTGPTGP